MNTRIVLLVVGLLLPAVAMAEELTLARAVELALAHAPAMREAEAARNAARQERAIGQAGLLPRIDLTANYQLRRQKTRYDEPRTLFEPDLKYRDGTIGMRAVQPLFDLERWAGYRRGDLSARAGEMRLRLERQKLVLEVAQACLEMITARAKLAAAEAKEAAAERLARQAQAAFEAGVSAVNERLDAESRRDLARAERLAAANDLDQAKANLASLIGVEIEGIAAPALAPALVLPGTEQIGLWEERAEADAVAVRLAELQFRTAEAAKLGTWGSALPKVEAFGEMSGNRASSGQLGTGTRTRNSAIGIQVSVPLLNGGGDYARLKKSEQDLLQAEFALRDDIRLARLAARQALLGYISAAAQLAAMRQAIVSAGEASEAARMGHEVGLRTVTDVLDADERRYAAEQGLAEAQANFVFAELQLLASIGRLDSRPLPELFGGGLELASQ